MVLLHNWDEVKRSMWDYVGIVRTSKRLERARTAFIPGKEINELLEFKVDESLQNFETLSWWLV